MSQRFLIGMRISIIPRVPLSFATKANIFEFGV